MLKGTSQKKKITHNKTQAQRQEDMECLEGSFINKTDKHSAYKSAQFICFPTVKKAMDHTFILLIIQPPFNIAP